MDSISSIKLWKGVSGYVRRGGSAYEKIYHTQYGTLDDVSYSLLELSGRFTLSSLVKFSVNVSQLVKASEESGQVLENILG